MIDETIRIFRAMFYSLNGLRYAILHESSFRVELLILCPLCATIPFYDKTNLEKLALFGSILLVILFELVNTAIEIVVDRISTKRHPLSKAAKDIGSLLVLLAICYMFVVWYVII